MDNGKVIKFPNRRDQVEKAREQACVWLARLDAEESSSGGEVCEEIKAWAGADPLNARMLLEMATLWDQLDVLSELADIFPLRQEPPARDKLYQRRGFLTGAAAMLLVGVGAGHLAWDRMGLFQPSDEGQFTYSTEIGEYSTISLPDGSDIVLNTNTLIEVDYSADGRNIYLRRGEGLFNVSPDEQRPFRVFAGSRMVEAVGTEFSVQHLEDASVEVMVTEGKVRFLPLSEVSTPLALTEPDRTAVSMTAGDYALAGGQLRTAAIEKVRLAVPAMEAKLAWRHGMLLFEGESLSDVLREVSRYTTIRIEADSSISDIQVEGYFRAGDINGLLVAMRNNFNINVRRISENQIYLSPL